MSCARLPLTRTRCAALHPSQVWENTPGFGDAPFLDTLWAAVDEVGTPLPCGRVACGAFALLAVRAASRGCSCDAICKHLPRPAHASFPPAHTVRDVIYLPLFTPTTSQHLPPFTPTTLHTCRLPPPATSHHLQAIDLKDTDVYTYKTDDDANPFGDRASLWSFNFFFYNKKMKRILYISCRALSKASAAAEVRGAAAWRVAGVPGMWCACLWRGRGRTSRASLAPTPVCSCQRAEQNRLCTQHRWSPATLAGHP